MDHIGYLLKHHSLFHPQVHKRGCFLFGLLPTRILDEMGRNEHENMIKYTIQTKIYLKVTYLREHSIVDSCKLFLAIEWGTILQLCVVHTMHIP